MKKLQDVKIEVKREYKKAFHEKFEEKDFKAAAEILKQAKDKGYNMLQDFSFVINFSAENSKQDHSLIKFFLEQGLNPNLVCENFALLNGYPLITHVVRDAAVYFKAKNLDEMNAKLDMIDELMECDDFNPNVRSKKGGSYYLPVTPLFIALEAYPVAKKLLKSHRVLDVDLVDEDGTDLTEFYLKDYSSEKGGKILSESEAKELLEMIQEHRLRAARAKEAMTFLYSQGQGPLPVMDLAKITASYITGNKP